MYPTMTVENFERHVMYRQADEYADAKTGELYQYRKNGDGDDFYELDGWFYSQEVIDKKIVKGIELTPYKEVILYIE